MLAAVATAVSVAACDMLCVPVCNPGRGAGGACHDVATVIGAECSVLRDLRLAAWPSYEVDLRTGMGPHTRCEMCSAKPCHRGSRAGPFCMLIDVLL